MGRCTNKKHIYIYVCIYIYMSFVDDTVPTTFKKVQLSNFHRSALRTAIISPELQTEPLTIVTIAALTAAATWTVSHQETSPGQEVENPARDMTQCCAWHMCPHDSKTTMQKGKTDSHVFSKASGRIYVGKHALLKVHRECLQLIWIHDHGCKT